MQDKFELSDELLPLEIYYDVGQRSSNSDLLNFALTSTEHLKLFKPMLDVRKFLGHVVRGEHEAVKALLAKDMSLMGKRGTVTDCSGRTFEHISAFEYALWALDKHMWTMMLECIPKNEEGKKVLAKLLSQYDQVNTEEVTYRLHGKTITEKHFDFANTIIRELKTQVDSLKSPETKNWNAIEKQWKEGVGGAQKLLPTHVVDEYCSKEPFYPVPKFTTRPKSSKQFYNYTTQKNESWFSLDSRLGVDFAIYKGPVVATRTSGAAPLKRVLHDLDVMTALCKVRTKEFADLRPLLEKQMTVDNQPQVFQM